MARTKGTVVSAPTELNLPANEVGDAFVMEYYRVLHTTPNRAYMFYQENSRLARPSAAAGGGMDSVTTIEAIKKKIMEMDVSGVKTEIDTVDSHLTPGGGIIVLIKGSATVPSTGGGWSRRFSQSFLLAPQLCGYYLLEDTLHYVG